MKKFFLIIIILICSSFQTITPTPHNYILISEVKLFMRDDGVFIILHDGIVSPCFTKKYFDAYYPCSKFNIDVYIDQLKKELRQKKQPEQPQTRKIYRL